MAIPLEHYQIFISCSIGISIFPDHGKNAEDLLKNADTAMYKAKDEGKNAFHYYSEDMTKKSLERITLENYLRSLITHFFWYSISI